MIDWNEFRTASQVMASKIVKRGRISSTTGSGRGDTGDRFLVEGSEKPTGNVMQRFAPWGHGGRPVAGSEYIAVSPGAGSALALVGVANAGYGNQSLEEGETELYCLAADCKVFLDKNGGVFITSTTGQLIKVAGGTDFMLKGTTYRNAETTFHFSLNIFLGILTTYVTAIKPIADPTNAASPPMLTGITNLTAALTTFENAASTYLSTIAKVG